MWKVDPSNEVFAEALMRLNAAELGLSVEDAEKRMAAFKANVGLSAEDVIEKYRKEHGHG